MARILIDALGADSPGGRRHIRGLLSALADRAGSHRFEVAVRRSFADEHLDLSRGPIEFWPLSDPIARPMATRLVLDVLAVPLRAWRRGFDLVVTLANFGPIWTASPHVVVQQNAMPYSPEYLMRIGGLQRLEWRLRGWLTVAEMRRATLTVTPTDALADLIRRAHPSLADRRFRTLFHAVDLAEFRPAGGVETAAASKRPFVFFCPTKVEAYKGLEILVAALEPLAERCDDFEVLVTAPDTGWPASIQQAIDSARGRPSFSRLRFAGAQTPARMPELYRAADAVVYPSLCESFGFPLLESMASGVPIVAAESEVNREICGDAARFYPAKSAEGLARAMERLRVDLEERRRLCAAGRARIAGRDWSWAAYARRFVEICESALDPALR